MHTRLKLYKKGQSYISTQERKGYENDRGMSSNNGKCSKITKDRNIIYVEITTMSITDKEEEEEEWEEEGEREEEGEWEEEE